MGVPPPTGTVTFLFTDVVGSTVLWEASSDPMRDAMARHDTLLDAVITEHDGYVFATGGDGVAAAFARAGDAVRAAVAAQAALLGEAWPPDVSLSVRMGLHSGETDERDGSFFGAVVNRAAADHVGRTWWADPRVGCDGATRRPSRRDRDPPGRPAPSAWGERARRGGRRRGGRRAAGRHATGERPD